MFEQAPGFMAMLEGPEHRFTMAYATYAQLVGGRDVVGKTLAEAIPEVEAQGFVRLLDEVLRSGKPHVGFAVPVELNGPRGSEVMFSYGPTEYRWNIGTDYLTPIAQITDNREAFLAVLARMHDEGDKSISIDRVG